MRSLLWSTAVLITVLQGGCGGQAGEPADQAATATLGDTAAATRPLAADTGAALEAEALRLHLRQMQGVRGDSLRAMLPVHRQMLAGLMARSPGMPMMHDAGWQALMDSLHRDMALLADPSGLSATAMDSIMAVHRGRVERMLDMHPGWRGRVR